MDEAGRACSRGAAPAERRRTARAGRLGAARAHGARKACSARTCMASVDVPVALLGYGTVGAAVNRLLVENADDIERATGPPAARRRARSCATRTKERDYPVDDGVLTTDFAVRSADDPSIALVAEVMGGVEPTGGYVLDLLARRQARRHREQAARRAARRRALRGRVGSAACSSASRRRVCAAIPVIKVLRESLVVTNVHRVLGIVNGTTNFILTRMEQGADLRGGARRGAAARLRGGRSDRRRLGRRRGGEDGDPRDGRVRLARRRSPTSRTRASRGSRPTTSPPARELDMVVRLVGSATLVDGSGRRARRPGARRPPPSARRGRGRVQRGHAPGRRDPRDHARGPGRGRDRDGLGGRRRHGQRRRHDRHRLPPERRLLARRSSRLPPGELRSPFYVRLEVDDRPGVLAHVARLPRRARRLGRALVQHHANGGAALHVVTHEAPRGRVEDALDRRRSLTRGTLAARGVPRDHRPRRLT